MVRKDRMAGRVILVLEGRIIREWADALEEECWALIGSGLRVRLDLSGVVFIDRQGIEALRHLSLAGLAIKGCSPWIAGMLEEEGIKVLRKREQMNDRLIPWGRRKCFDA